MWSFIKGELARIKNTFVWSWDGWAESWRTEKSLRQWSLANILSAGLTFVFPMTATQQAMIVGLGVLVLAAELMNTAIEAAIDYISTEQHPMARKAKDAGSASVALTAIAAGVVWVFVLIDVYG